MTNKEDEDEDRQNKRTKTHIQEKKTNKKIAAYPIS